MYREKLIALRDFLVEEEIPFVFGIYPSHKSVSGERSDLLNWTARMSRGAGIPTYDFWEPLNSSGEPTTVTFLRPIDGHPSPQGYAMAAGYLINELMNEEPIRTLCGQIFQMSNRFLE